jgi:replicative DNA helicase
LLKTLDKHKPQQPLILALDKDEAGQAAEKALMEGLERLGIPYIQADISGAYKDANEAFMGDTIAFITAVNAAQQSIKAALQDEQDIKRREYMGTSAAGHMAAFRDVVASSINTKPVSTGFAALDRALDGGVYEGLIFIGGITSSGKTTLALQMADSMAMQGQDVLIFSLEMARYELMAKSISRLTLRNCLLNKRDTSNAKTTRDVLSGARQALFSKEERALYEQACRQYEDYAEHLYISEGMGDIGVNEIRATIQKHITFTGSKPAVLIDYLQLLAPYNERYTDKQNTDKAVLELKRISRDFKVPVLAVSSLNRASYKNSIDLEAFKESGAIEYSSDVLLGLQYEGTGDDNFDRDKQAMAKQRKMELKVLKQRNAPKGMSIQLDYYAFANYFHEKIGQ